MSTTPWDEARLDAVDALSACVIDKRIGARMPTQEEALDAALSTLSRLGYRLVPAEATEDMIKGKWTGDVLKP